MKHKSIGLLLALLMACSLCVAEAAPIILDGSSSGRQYDGIGALSAGASSRLLIDYPEPQRSEVLDFLFKPHFGAALQICKVEIGGDVNSTDGSEQSHMHTATDENYHRGYEWWLMREAKKRNPNIKLWALEWGAPAWINPTGRNVWTDNNITYTLNFLKHARSDYGLTIDYVGGWNEHGYDVNWIEKLRSALDTNGFAGTKIVCDDSFKWSIGPNLQSDAAFFKSVDIIGNHYVNTSKKNLSDPNWQAVLATGKPIWQSEMGSSGYITGGAGLARQVNWGYIDDRVTGNTNWSTIWSVFKGFPFDGDGLMLASEPWSGHYLVGSSIWAFAHTTQFADIGWKYLDKSCGFFDDDSSHGSYVTLKSPTSGDYSLTIETIGAPAHTALFTVTQGLSSQTLHVWRTNFHSVKPTDWFVRLPDIRPVDHSFTVSLEPDCIYSLTTTSGQTKGASPSPSPATSSFPLPYHESFTGYTPGATPRYLSDIEGSFEIAQALGGRKGHCLRQCAVGSPVFWSPRGNPLTVVGDPLWENYAVSSDVLLEGPGSVDLVGRASGDGAMGGFAGYHLRIADTGAWSLIAAHGSKEAVLASGTASISTMTWHTLGLQFDDDRISASIDGKTVVDKLEDAAYDSGMAGYQVNAWQPAQFMNLSIVPRGKPLPDLKATATASSFQPGYEPGKAVDGETTTMWHTMWSPTAAQLPQYITLDLRGTYGLTRLKYVPRQDGEPNGTITQYNIYVSMDGVSFGAPIASGSWDKSSTIKKVLLRGAKARYVRLEGVQGVGGFCSASEVSVAGTRAP